MSAKLPTHERLISLLDADPWSAFYRIGLGYVIPLLYYRTPLRESSGWLLVLWFLVFLITLRLLPAVFRKVLPFGREVKAIWTQRRQAAKRYDSYQWRKLIWFGIGMVCWVEISWTWNAYIIALTAFCILGGGLGHVIWRYTCNAENVTIE